MHRSPQLVRRAAMARYGGGRAFTESVRSLPRRGDYRHGTSPSGDERRGSRGLPSDQRVATAICELWRLLPGGDAGISRNFARHFSPTSCNGGAIRHDPPAASCNLEVNRELAVFEGNMRIVIVGGGTGGHL